MGRYSPSVVPQAVPGLAENLALALEQGFGAHEHFVDRRQRRDDRDRELMDREDQLALHGIHAPGWTPEETEAEQSSKPVAKDRTPGKPPAFSSDLQGALESQDGFVEDNPTGGGNYAENETPTARSASGHPGGWDPRSRSFEKVSPKLPAPERLPSGRVYDRAGEIRSSVAQKLLERQGEMDLKQQEHDAGVQSRLHALEGLRGQPGFEALTDALVQAGAEDPETFRKLVENQPPAWHPHSMEEALEVSGRQAEQSAAASARHRDPSATGARAADDFAYRMVTAAAAANPGMKPEDLARVGQSYGEREQATAERLGLKRSHYYSAADRFAHRDVAKSKAEEEDDNAFLAVVNAQDPSATHSRNLPSQQSAPAGTTAPVTKAPAAPDSLLNELDQQFGGNVDKIRTELKKRGYDPDA